MSELHYFKRIVFATKRERRIYISPGQGRLFDEAEADLVTGEEDLHKEDTDIDSNRPKEESEGTKGRRKKQKTACDSAKNAKSRFPEKFERVRKVVDLPEENKVCKKHKVLLKKVGSTLTERLDIVPAKLRVIEEERLTYKCPCCEGEEVPSFVKAPAEDALLSRVSIPAELLAYIIVNKFVDGLPLYRQQRIFQRLGAEFNRNSFASWVIKAGQACQPIMNLMHEDLLASSVLNADETIVHVLNEQGKPAKSKSYMWTIGRQGPYPAVMF